MIKYLWQMMDTLLRFEPAYRQAGRVSAIFKEKFGGLGEIKIFEKVFPNYGFFRIFMLFMEREKASV
jgi:predicted ATP-dependent serine protease